MRIAASQHDQVTLAQLLDAGLSQSTVGDRVKNGRLHRSHRGVYSLGHPPASSLEHWMAAVLACGEGAALSDASGAANLGIRASAATLVDVTSPTGRGRALPGIRVHRSRLEPWEVTIVDGIPTTTCARTLLDLAETIHPEALAQALDQAEIAGVFDLTDLQRTLAHNHGRHGLHPLRALLSSLDPATKQTRNDFDRASTRSAGNLGSPSQSQINGCIWKAPGSSPTSSGQSTALSSRPTAGRPTAPARPSSETAPRTRS